MPRKKKGKIVQTRRIAGVVHRKRIVDDFSCGTCGTTYEKLREAIACAKRPNEKRQFKVGDKVTWLEHAICSHGSRDSYFPVNAIVTKIRKREPMDSDYCSRHLQGALRNQHVIPYEVEFQCGCRRKKRRSMLLYSAEMRRRSGRVRAPKKK